MLAAPTSFGFSFCAAAIWATGSITAIAASDDASKQNQESAPPAVIISENVTTVVVPTSYFFGDAWKQQIDMSFVVRSASSVKHSVAITSSGIGNASFLISGTGADAAKPFLQTEVDENGKRIILRLSRDLLPSSSTSLEGKIVVLVANSKPVEALVKIERPSPLVFTSFQWFWAIVLPAAVGALLTYFGTRLAGSWTARSAALTGFGKFKDENYTLLSTFFTAFYPTASKGSDEDFAKNLDAELRKKNILSAVAGRERRKLEIALRRRDRSKIKQCLRKLFSEWNDCFEIQDQL